MKLFIISMAVLLFVSCSKSESKKTTISNAPTQLKLLLIMLNKVRMQQPLKSEKL